MIPHSFLTQNDDVWLEGIGSVVLGLWLCPNKLLIDAEKKVPSAITEKFQFQEVPALSLVCAFLILKEVTDSFDVSLLEDLPSFNH